MRETEADKIRERSLSSGEVDLNYSAHKVEDIEGAMDSLGTMPFLAEKRVVLIKEDNGFSDEFTEAILSYLARPMETSVLVLSTGSSFKKNKNYHKLAGLVNVIKADKPDPVTIKGWIRDFFKKEGIEISPKAVELIVGLKGSDAIAVKGELEKLVCFSGGEKIENTHVEQLVGRSVTEDVFKLVDAVNARDTEWAFRVLNDLYDQKKQPHEIIGYLAWYIRAIQKVVLLSGRGSGPEGIAAELGFRPWQAKKFLDQAKKYPVKKINHWTSLLLETDRDIKTGRKRSPLALEMLLVNLLNM
jgi:DNA polymerase-3 subunit delta